MQVSYEVFDTVYGGLMIDRSGWAARSKYLASDVINCTAILTYTAELVRPGLVSFTYQHGDDSILFTFEVLLSSLLCLYRSP